MGFLHSKRIQNLGGGSLERLGVGVISRINLVMLGAHKDRATLDLIRSVRRQRRFLLTANEAYTVHSLARAQATRPGIMAEVGVYQGGSAKIICECKGQVPLYLFDTFEGLPIGVGDERDLYEHHQYATSVESVQRYLDGYPNVYLTKGLFPASVEEIQDGEFSTLKFSFVHLDVDLYESTAAALEYFYSRMIPGGVILSHDYSLLKGVKQAFTEFFAEKPEPVIELLTSQCMVVKLGE